MNDYVTLGYAHSNTLESLFVAARDRLRAEEPRIKNQIEVHSGPKVDDARNEIVKQWLTHYQTDRLLMVDDDMVLRTDMVDRLIAHRKDIVGGLYFTGGFSTPKRPHLYVIEEQEGKPTLQVLWDYPLNSLVEVNGTGAGCLLITRRVCKAIWRARGKEHPMPWFAFGAHNNVPIGEDIAFCLTAGRLGYPTYVDTSLVIGHIKPTVVTDLDYVRSLSDSSHPHYTEREKVPIYREMVYGDASLDSDRPSDSGVQKA